MTETKLEDVLTDPVAKVVNVEIAKVSLAPGDVLHIQLGIQDMGDGLPPWLPTPEEIEFSRRYWQAFVPAGVKVLVTHCGEKIGGVIENEQKRKEAKRNEIYAT
jgi:hypothetical protein